MSGELLKQNMWAASAVAVRRSLPIFLTVSAGIVFLTILSDMDGRSFSGAGTVGTIVWCYLAFAAHSIVLKNTAGSDLNAAGRPMLRFVWRTLVLSIVPVLFLIPVVIIAIQSDEISKEELIALFLVLAAPIYLIFFGLFGTMLPAVVMEEDYSFARSLKRGLKTFFPTIGKMIIGPGALLVAIGILATLYPFYVGDGRVLDADFNFNPLNLIPEVTFTLISAFSTVLGAVVLSKAYITGEEKLGPPDGSNSPEPSEEQEPITVDSKGWTGN